MKFNDHDRRQEVASEIASSETRARRAFLENCAKYAIGMPPAIALLLSAKSALGCHNQGMGKDQNFCSGDDDHEDPEIQADPEQTVPQQ